MTKKIFVGGLSWETSETSIRHTFERFGVIRDLRLVIDRHTGRSKGFAFVTFESDMSADVALNQMNGCRLDGRVLKVNSAIEKEGPDADAQPASLRFPTTAKQHYPRERFAPAHSVPSPSPNSVFVGGITPTTDQEALRTAFSRFGDIEEVKIIMDRDTGMPKGFGFVTFRGQGAADEAIASMDGCEIDGKSVRVSAASYKNKKGGMGGRNTDRY